MNSSSTLTAQMALPLALGDKASFNNYWLASSTELANNKELVSALKASIQTGEPKLIYFYGGAGAGKSHLLFAAMRLAQQNILNTSYLSLKTPDTSAAMLSVIDAEHLVCIDDVDAWAGDDENERALFTLFEQIKHQGGRLLLSATQPPELSGFGLRDLESRLSSGLVYPVHELKEEQLFEAIKMRASQRGLSISDETVKYLLSRSSRDTHELFFILDQIDQASLIEKKRITIPFLRAKLNF